MTALTFDPRAFLESQVEGCRAAKGANPANRAAPRPEGLAALAGLAGGHSRTCVFEGAGRDAVDDWTPAVRAIRDARLPAAGTPERALLDLDQTAAVAGYQRAALARPVSWSDPTALPVVGCYCRNCGGRSWWCETGEPSGWRCATCHPGVWPSFGPPLIGFGRPDCCSSPPVRSPSPPRWTTSRHGARGQDRCDRPT